MDERKKIKIILNNGYKYEGVEQSGNNGFTTLLDSKDNKIRRFPNTAISVIEVLE